MKEQFTKWSNIKRIWQYINVNGKFFSGKIFFLLLLGTILMLAGQSAQIYAPILLGKIVNMAASMSFISGFIFILIFFYGLLFWFGRASNEMTDIC